MTRKTTPDLAKFALRTSDTAWIARNNGTAGEDGKTFVMVPASQVERVTIARQPMLRHRFADAPADMPNAAVICPAAWVEAPEVTAERPEALDGRALFLAMARAEGSMR